MFYQPFNNMPEQIDDATSKKLKQQAQKAIKKVIQSLKAFEGFYLKQYQSQCQQQVGIDKLPSGSDYYQHRIKVFTTTNNTAEQIHQIGLSEVARIRAEMQEVIKDSGFDGDFRAFQKYLRTNPDFYPKTAEQRMTEVAKISKKIDGLLPELFTRYPRIPYGIKEIPEDIAEENYNCLLSATSGRWISCGVLLCQYQ